MGAADAATTQGSLHIDTSAALDATLAPLTGPGDTGSPHTGMLLEGLDTGVRLAPVTAPGPDTGMLPGANPRAPAGANAPVRAGARPAVVQLAIREKAALYAAYMPFLEGGGLFVPTTRTVHLGDELYLILSLMDDPGKLSVTGKVVWITPAATPQRQQGLGVQFARDEAGTQARRRIEELLGGTLKANRPTHTI